MAVTDPIADFLTRVRNAVKARKKFVEIPSSSTKVSMAEILKESKFINDYTIIEDNKQNILKIKLKYSEYEPSISGLKKISKPGLRQYVGAEDLPRVYNGLGIAIISTNKGLLTDRQAKEQKVGGEVICHVW